MKKCPDCGKEVSKSAKICPNCGKKLKGHIVLGIVIAFIGVCVIISAVSGYETDDESSKYKQNKETTITVVDFSTMTEAEIDQWCDSNKVNCTIEKEYSDSIAKDGFISQSVENQKTIYEGDKITIVFSLGKEPTTGEKNALSKAKTYLNTMAFSYSGLIKQLEFEGFSTEEATYGADNCGADWNEQAVKKAKDYLNTMSFSKSSLIQQLEFEGFTAEQATYGAEQNGY